MEVTEKQFTHTTGGQVANHPLCVSITLLLVCEHGLVCIPEGEVEGLGWEVTDDVGRVTTPQGDNTLVASGTTEALDDTIVLAVQTARLQHLILYANCSVECSSDNVQHIRQQDWGDNHLVLDEEFDTLNGRSGGLRDGGGDTAHYSNRKYCH